MRGPCRGEFGMVRAGTQNGFVILFVEPRNDPEHVERVVMNRHGPGGIAPETREAAVFLRDGAGV
jgi:hypothetical protein